ncbi:MAG: HAMP domain-containing histidine kinase [Oscillospiraceae bacterium]|nr:HAMP domain-containing histidine kinase [Oscillospiraceae bacterium]
MIRKLRWKVVAVTMAVVTAVLLGAMAAVLLSSRAALENQNRDQLRQALQGEAFLPERSGDRAAERAARRIFVAEVYAGGTVRLNQGAFEDLGDEETVLAIINACLAKDEDYGLLEEYDLRYLRQSTPLYLRIAFADSSLEQGTLRAMRVTAALVGAAAFLALLGLSYLLSGLVTKPVEKAWQQQQQFLSDASHELKTPLTVILSSADLLAETASADSAGYVDNIRSESRRMKKLVENMLTLARADDGGHSAAFTLTDWSDTVIDTALRFEPVAFEAGRRLLYDIDENLAVWGDGEQLGRLTAILLDNAIKYAPEGTEVRLSLRREDKTARLTVENGGTPVPPEKIPHLFDRFYRLDEARSDTEGFGLGLAIARSIVTQHGGSIHCESDSRSTRFVAILPVKKAAAQASAAAAAHILSGREKEGGDEGTSG